MKVHRIFIMAAALILAVALAGQGPARALEFHEAIGQLLKKHHFTGKIQHLPQPIAIFHVPVKVTNMPPSWRDAELLVVGMIFFYDANGSEVGKTVGCASFPNALKTGSCQKKVTLRCYRLEGMVTEKFDSGLGVLAKGEGGQIMVLGAANKERNETQFTVTSYTPVTAKIYNIGGNQSLCGQ